MHKYILIGIPGSGKGTQASLLRKDFDLVHISVGDIFRWNIESHTKLAARIQRLMREGKLVADEIVEEVVSQRLEQHDWNFGYILDGFPRNRNQAMFFLETYNIDAAIYIHVPEKAVIERMLSRYVEVDGKMVRREDDHENIIRRRIQEFNEKTVPAIDLFREKGLLIEVDGTRSVDDVQWEIREALGLPQREPSEDAKVC